MTQEQYDKIIVDLQAFREEWLDPNYAAHPELFPVGFEKGYEMNGHYHAKRQGIVIRRIALWNGDPYQIRPSLMLPMMVGRVDEVAGGLLMRKFGVPYWAITYVFGRNATFWYRRLERNAIGVVGVVCRRDFDSMFPARMVVDS